MNFGAESHGKGLYWENLSQAVYTSLVSLISQASLWWESILMMSQSVPCLLFLQFVAQLKPHLWPSFLALISYQQGHSLVVNANLCLFVLGRWFLTVIMYVGFLFVRDQKTCIIPLNFRHRVSVSGPGLVSSFVSDVQVVSGFQGLWKGYGHTL